MDLDHSSIAMPAKLVADWFCGLIAFEVVVVIVVLLRWPKTWQSRCNSCSPPPEH